MFLSVITPTYNRRHTLSRCYLSLCEQTDGDFEWIVVDDGSTDDTEQLISEFINENKIPIRYFYKENGGKPSAHNLGVKNAVGEMCICVDSDDALTPDAVEVAKRVWRSGVADGCIGILAKRGSFEDKSPLCTSWPPELTHSRMIELQEKHGFSGDTALFFITSIMKEHYFAEFKGEKFVPEDALYSELDELGHMYLLNEILYYCEYLEGGLTSDYRGLLLRNPMGTAYCYYKRFLAAKSLRSKLKNAIISEAYLLASGRRPEYKKERGGLILLLAKPFAFIYRKSRIGGH